MQQQVTTLSYLNQGEKFEVIHLGGSGEIRKRLLDMGFIPGAKGVSLHQGLLKDPIEIQLGAYKISIRRTEAEKIHVIFFTEDNSPKIYPQNEILPSTGPGFYADKNPAGVHKKKENIFRKFFRHKMIHQRREKDLDNFKINEKRKTTGKNLIRVAIAGNPNTGKSSLFNAITGARARVGNYPGVTVDTKRVRIEYKGYKIEFIDLPGTYSLTAYSFEEVISRDFILYNKPDVVLDVMDSTNLERNLYLCLQFQELGVPIVGALNMIDESDKLGIRIDSKNLSNLLQIPLIKTSAYYKKGIESLLEQILETALEQREIAGLSGKNDIPFGKSEPVGRHLNYGKDLEEIHNQLIRDLSLDAGFTKKYSLHWVAIKLIENDEDAAKKISQEHKNGKEILDKARNIRRKIHQDFGMDATSLVAQQRYGFIHGALNESVTIEEKGNKRSFSESLDAVALHRFGGLAVFFLIMYLIYSLTFSLGNILSDYIGVFFQYIAGLTSFILPHGILQDFVANGIIGGVGGVLVFLPIILLIFAGLSFLEDSGYLARAAFVMDKLMHRFGMHGKSFIPLMLSTGCAVPAVMSTRALANQKDRIITSLVLPMMMCTAKTPVIAMLIGAFFSEYAGLYFWLVWVFAWIISFISALILSKTIFRGDATPFVMELPPYRMPTLLGIIKHMWQKAVGYLKKAGTIILAASILTWILFYFPRINKFSPGINKQEKFLSNQIVLLKSNSTQYSKQEKHQKLKVLKERKLKLENVKRKQAIEHSFGGRLGKMIEPFFAIMGFDWKMSISLLAAFPAKEIIISTMGVVYGIGEVDIGTTKGKVGSLKETMRNDPSYNPLVAIVFIIFVLLYTPCFATLAVIKREMGGWRWVFFSVFFSFAIATILASSVFQLGRLIL